MHYKAWIVSFYICLISPYLSSDVYVSITGQNIEIMIQNLMS